MISRIIKYFRIKLLDKAQKGNLQRPKKIIFDNLKELRIIGGDYNEGDLALLKRFILKNFEEQINVKYLFFTNDKTIPTELVAQNDVGMITKKSINWIGKPKREISNWFLDGKEEMLLNLSLQSNYTFHLLSSMSSANLRIGRYNPEYKSAYDFMIEAEGNETKELFAKQIIYYLNVFKKQSNDK